MAPRNLLLLASTLFLLESRSPAADAGSNARDILTASSVLIAAHRGGYETDKADGAPENSVANIQNCQSKGYELYETDIQRTQDGHFVMVHDATIVRETTGTGKVSQMDLSELKTFRKRYRDRSISEEHVATLEEFLIEGKERTVYKADMKPGVSAHFKEIMQLVVKHDAMDGIIFRVPYGEADLFAQYIATGAPYAKHLLMFKTISRKQIDDIVKRFDPPTIQVKVSKSDPTNLETLELIRYATGQGLLVETHAEGSPDDWAKLVDAGVRMFHTNKPSQVRAFLTSRKNQD